MNFDPDGMETRLYVMGKKPGDPQSFGHVALQIHRGNKTVTYDFGRYGTARSSNKMFEKMGVQDSGPGILRVHKGDAYIKGEMGKRGVKEFTFKTSAAEEAKIEKGFNAEIKEGSRVNLSGPGEKFQLKDDYAIMSNSCVSQSLNPLTNALGSGEDKNGEGFSSFGAFKIDFKFKGIFKPSGVGDAAESLVDGKKITKKTLSKDLEKK